MDIGVGFALVCDITIQMDHRRLDVYQYNHDTADRYTKVCNSAKSETRCQIASEKDLGGNKDREQKKSVLLCKKWLSA